MRESLHPAYPNAHVKCACGASWETRSTGGDLPYLHEFGAGWHTHVAQLIAQLEGAPTPPFWPMMMQLRPEYEKARIAAQS